MAEGIAAKGPENPMASSPQPVDPNFFACLKCGRIYNRSLLVSETTTCGSCGVTRTTYGAKICPDCRSLSGTPDS